MISEYRLDPPDDPQGFTGETQHHLENENGEELTVTATWVDGVLDDTSVEVSSEDWERIEREGQNIDLADDYDDRSDEAYDRARDAEFDR